jgi:hypothetical protein
VTEESEKKAYGEPNLGLPADMIPQTSIRKGNQQYSGPANTAPAWTNSAQKELDQKIKAHQERVDRILKRKPSAPTQPAATPAATTQPQIQSQSFTSPAASEFLRTTKSPAAMPKPVVQPKKIQSESWTSPDAADFLTNKKASVKKASPAWQTSEGKSESGGLNDKGRASLKAQGHDIKRPQPEGGPRKDSFCARMKGMKSKLTSDETANDPDSRINKALRKWKCGSAQEKWAALATLALSSNAPTLGSVVQGPKAEKGHGIKFQFGTASNPSFLR